MIIAHYNISILSNQVVAHKLHAQVVAHKLPAQTPRISSLHRLHAQVVAHKLPAQTPRIKLINVYIRSSTASLAPLPPVRLLLLLLLFFSFPPSSFHIFLRFSLNFGVFSPFSCKMRSSIASGENNVALPSTISRKQDPEIAKSHIFLSHVSDPNVTNATRP